MIAVKVAGWRCCPRWLHVMDVLRMTRQIAEVDGYNGVARAGISEWREASILAH